MKKQMTKKMTILLITFLIFGNIGNIAKSQSFYFFKSQFNDRFLSDAIHNIEYVDNQTEELSVALSSGEEFPETILSLTNLRALRVCRAMNSGKPSVNSIPSKIANLQNLRHLILDELELSELPLSINKIDSLQSFYFSNRNTVLVQLPDFSGTNLKLYGIDLNSNGVLSTASNFNSIFDANLLTELYLSRCNLSATDLINIKNLSSLKFVDLSRNNLKDFNFICQNKNIEVLNLDNNHISEIPNEIENLHRLRFLSLISNEISTISSAIYNLKQLEVLYLNDNNIVELSSQIKNLENLKTLSLRGSDISELPESLFELSNLEVLDLYNTNIKSIPVGILKLKNLKELRISSKNVGDLVIDAKFLAQIKSLEYIQLTNYKTAKGIQKQKKKLKKLRPDLRL
jgi:Leucine-rich repeat (LRR) protein